MIPVDTLRELYEYNYWARDRQLEACAALTKEQFLRPMGNSFSSVRDTLVHLLWAEWRWLERWLGRPVSQTDAQGFPVEQFPDLAAIRDRWQVVESQMRSYLAALEDRDLAQPFTYLNWKGERWTYALWRTIFHLANHQMYHRGQITTLLRQLGAAAPPVDFLVAQDVGLKVRFPGSVDRGSNAARQGESLHSASLRSE